jgi:hypothetical protein
VTLSELIEGVCADIGERSRDRHVLTIQDTSEINLQRHADRVSGLGPVGNGTDLGFFIHPLLTVDALAKTCLRVVPSKAPLVEPVRGKEFTRS